MSINEYISDGVLYDLKKLLRFNKEAERDISLVDFVFPESGSTSELFFVKELIKLDITVSNLHFDFDGYSEFLVKEKDDGISGIEDHLLYSLKALKKYAENEFVLKNILKDRKFLIHSESLPYFKFSNKLDNKSRTIITNYLKDYLIDFQNDELLSIDSNYYNHQYQCQRVGEAMYNSIEKYGKSFVLKYPTHHDSNLINDPLNHDSEFLFVHSIFSLEDYGYIKVLDIDAIKEGSWDAYFPHEEFAVDTYKVALKVLNPEYFKDTEVNNNQSNVKKTSPKSSGYGKVTCVPNGLTHKGKLSPFRRGHYKVIKELYAKRKELRNGGIVTKGGFVKRDFLQSVGGYDEDGFRAAVKSIRKKLREAHINKGFPLLNVHSNQQDPKIPINNYQLEIDYDSR